MSLKAIKLLLCLALFTTVASCGNDNFKIVKISWVVEGPFLAKNGSLGQELSEWFIPFKDQKECPSARFLPKVELVRLDSLPDKEPIREALVFTEFSSIKTENNNFVQKIFTGQPKFEALVELAKHNLSGAKPKDELLIPMSAISEEDNRKIEKWLLDILKKSALIINRDEDRSNLDEITKKLNSINPESEKHIIFTGNDVNAFRSAIAKQFCSSTSSKEAAGDTVILLNLGRNPPTTAQNKLPLATKIPAPTLTVPPAENTVPPASAATATTSAAPAASPPAAASTQATSAVAPARSTPVPNKREARAQPSQQREVPHKNATQMESHKPKEVDHSDDCVPGINGCK